MTTETLERAAPQAAPADEFNPIQEGQRLMKAWYANLAIVCSSRTTTFTSTRTKGNSPSLCVRLPASSPTPRSYSSRSHSRMACSPMRAMRIGCSTMSSAMRHPPSRRKTDIRSRVATVNATVCASPSSRFT